MLDTDRTKELEGLRLRLVAMDGYGRADGAVLPFGVPAIDAALPGRGLALGALHEVSGIGPDEEDGAIAAAFLAGILARLEPAKPVLWCLGAGGLGFDLFGPGLAASGLAPERLVVARVRAPNDLLWAMEEGLRSPGLAAVVGEMETLPGPSSRRLQLAAETSGVTAFVLRRWRGPVQAKAPNAAVTRWSVRALPSDLRQGEPGVGVPLWRLELWRARGAAPAYWNVEASNATGHVSLPAALGDGAVARRYAAGA